MEKLSRACRHYMKIFLFYIALFALTSARGQVRLEKMPPDLETAYALSALPVHLREKATVYLLDPEKGYYVSRRGTNGFICFVSRTEWEWTEFREDLATPISYDAEGARSIFPVYFDVAAMRASGNFNPVQIHDTIKTRILRGYYKAPSRAGISYMLSPLMRVYPGMPDNKTILTISGPHYMFYAPYVSNEDLGFQADSPGPVLNSPGQQVFGEKNAPYGYIIMGASESEKAIILENGRDLMEQLARYKPWFKVQQATLHHNAKMP